MRRGDKVMVGVAGTIGSGKTKVCRIFENFGAQYISADEVGWEVLPEISDELKQRFGEVIMNGHTVNKKRLRSIVFSSQKNLDDLNKLSHPLLIKKILQQVEEIGSGIIVIDAALLFDWPEVFQITDYPILVIADDSVKEERMVKRGMDRHLFRQILRSQRREGEMSKHAKYIIENNSTVAALKAQCQNIYKEIKYDC